mmetsp:Transcript_29823/g.77201  ORF Transcript_29823/g.77201 Transcript_29823/m.77201 type:complete len:458 (+) Transcript_29823:70-1443(+)
MAEGWTPPPLSAWGDGSASSDCPAIDEALPSSSACEVQAQRARKRPAEELEAQNSLARVRRCGESYEAFAPYQQLSGVQRAIIARIIGMLDTEKDSVVISNPQQPQSPIVYVTNAWQDMCGYNSFQAIGRNPRVTQGEGSDPATIAGMRTALSNQQACRVRLINYRGYNHEPFWNCLSVQPIFFQKKLVLFAARLQDYSHRLTRLVSLQPAQFCKSGSCFQYRVRLGQLKSARSLSQARCVDVTAKDLRSDSDSVDAEDDDTAGDSTDTSDVCGPSMAGPAQQLPGVPTRHVKRLGFGGLVLEPEYLLDRLRHECHDLGMPCVSQELEFGGTEVMRMEIHGRPILGDSVAGGASSSGGGGSGGGGASSSLALAVADGGSADGGDGGLRAVVHVMPEDDEGTYAISLMRLVGDTFAFHSLYRKLRSRLEDITLLPSLASKQPPPRTGPGASLGLVPVD